MDGYCMLRRALLIKSIRTVQYAQFAIKRSVKLKLWVESLGKGSPCWIMQCKNLTRCNQLIISKRRA